MAAPRDAREWVSFEDPDEDRTWVIDVTFLVSSWHCIYGAGCQGVLTMRSAALAQGCCSYGAHFGDGDDLQRTEAAAATLTADQWQFVEEGRRDGIVRYEGEAVVTALVDDACIFLNRPGFAGGVGCALHRAAIERNVPPRVMKPDVCWQLPLRREDTLDDRGHVTSILTEWQRHHWGEAGSEFAWWCTEAPAAFGAPLPVHRSLDDELRAMLGTKVMSRLRAYLDERERSSAPLPHPTVRRRKPPAGA